ncbi:LuxR C-terminal-related transcriptional regulator [Rhizobium sp. LjRoot30]|uniref:helix-turn-helix transcriptional regulator n=1 Tax=Rhizobium sp. LjRoot30 TaxID=3342320 RepID=UPI003ECC98C9
MISVERQLLLSAELSSAESRVAFMDAMSRVRMAFGFSHVTILKTPVPADMLLAPLILETTLPQQLVQEYDRHHLLRECAAVAKLKTSLMPQFWSITEAFERPGRQPSAVMLSLSSRFDLSMGVLFSVTGLDGQRLVIRYDGNRSRPSQSEINELAMLSLQAIESYNELRRRENAKGQILTERELEVVRWTAQGKTSVEIGQILSLSDHTVNAYLNNAIKKLDCVNRTQLVAKAIRLKLIT